MPHSKAAGHLSSQPPEFRQACEASPKVSMLGFCKNIYKRCIDNFLELCYNCIKSFDTVVLFFDILPARIVYLKVKFRHTLGHVIKNAP